MKTRVILLVKILRGESPDDDLASTTSGIIQNGRRDFKIQNNGYQKKHIGELPRFLSLELPN